MREIALDTETTGLDPASGHRIVEIGCVEMINRIRTGRVFHAYLDPERDMPEAAFKVHGISSEFLKGKPKFPDVAEEFIQFIADSTLVIHNAEFDLKFLNHEMMLIEQAGIPFSRAIDTVRIARAKFPGSPANLDALCRRFNIDLSKRDLHGALLDANLLAEVYLELTGGRQATLLEENRKSLSASAIHVERKFHEARNFPPSAEELEAHQRFVEKIKNAIWCKLDQESQAGSA